MKRKTLTIAISIFALIAIVSVGFASWVISRPTQDKDATGNITVEKVDDKAASGTKIDSIVLTDSNKKSLHFGKPADDTLSGAEYLSDAERWFKLGDNTQPECLSVSFTVKLTGTLDTNVDTLTAKVEVGTLVSETFTAYNASDRTGDLQKGYYKAADSNYITHVKITSGSVSTTNENEAITLTMNEDNKTATITVSIGWGEHFKNGNENLNPYKYYNLSGKTYDTIASGTTKWYEDASTAMKAIENLGENLAFKLTVTLAVKQQ